MRKRRVGARVLAASACIVPNPIRLRASSQARRDSHGQAELAANHTYPDRFASDGIEYSARLEGALEGEARQQLWDELASFVPPSVPGEETTEENEDGGADEAAAALAEARVREEGEACRGMPSACAPSRACWASHLPHF